MREARLAKLQPSTLSPLPSAFPGDDNVNFALKFLLSKDAGAFLTGMRYAIQRGADIIIKLDADGQMNPAQVPALIHPIAVSAAHSRSAKAR